MSWLGKLLAAIFIPLFDYTAKALYRFIKGLIETQKERAEIKSAILDYKEYLAELPKDRPLTEEEKNGIIERSRKINKLFR